jgi:DNA polymerase elongation subunit (family B)
LEPERQLHQQDLPVQEKRKRYDDLVELPEDRPSLLLSAVYSGEERKVYLKFYDPRDNIIYHWRDRTNHQPYAYSKLQYSEAVDQIVAKEPNRYSVQHLKKRDVIADKEIEVLKVTAPDPLSIGGTDTSLREKVRCWEADIKYHENYLYDRGLIPGIYYVRHGDRIEQYTYKISEKVETELKGLLWDKIKEEGEAGKEYRKYVTTWANLLNQPIPELKRVAVDIEVESEEGRMPTPRDHDRRVTAVGFASNDGMRKVLVLGENMNDNGKPLIKEAEVCKNEKELLEKAFAIINSYPIIVTFNGDDFDLPYLYARSQDARISSDGKAIPRDAVPIMVKKESFIKHGMQAEPVGVRHGIHIDLFRTFQNRSIQIYAFSRKYTEFTLNAICEALLEDSKLEFEGDISELPMQTLAEYCMKDAELTFRLTSFGDNLLMKLLVVIARIGRMSVDDIARFGVNQWIRGILYFEHRQRNELIPRTDELHDKGTASTAAVIKEKKYRGGEVVEPTPGIHFSVVVLDFASLYPSIIKVHNLSYETINCVHPACRETGKIEGTTHWVCQQRKGLSSLLIGSLRDLRVNYYKHLSKDKTLPGQERQLYNVVSQAIKVILNACFTGDTEVLTPDGIRNIKDFRVGDLVYTLNETTHQVEIKPVVDIQHFKYSDNLIKIQSDHVDWEVTGNHKLYLGTSITQYNGTVLMKWNKIDASNVLALPGRQYLFRHDFVSGSSESVTSLWKYIPDEKNIVVIRSKMAYDRHFSNSQRWTHYSFAEKLAYNKPGRCYYTNKQLIDSLCSSPEEFEQRFNCKLLIRNSEVKGRRQAWQVPTASLFRLIGWYVTEGSIQDARGSSKSKYVRITITQSAKHESNRNSILATIRDLGYIPKIYGMMISFTSTLIGDFLLSECGSGSKNKHLPRFVFSASPENRQALLETMMCGDGNIENRIYSTISESLARDVQHLAFTLGIETSIREERLPSGGIIFRVQLYGRKHHCLKPKHYSSEPATDLDVYCITAKDNHVIYAGRNGKMGWIGQSYGVMGAEIFPLYCLPVADATAAIGRNTINATIHKCKDLGIEVVYGDSVLPDTPITIKKSDGSIDIVPIESLIPKTVRSTRYDKFGDLDVLTDHGFSKIRYAYRHKVKKKGYRILTRKALVECTEDHSLVIKDKEVKPSQLAQGDKIELVCNNATGSNVSVNPDLAWLFGFFIAEGTCDTYQYKKKNKGKEPSLTEHPWRIVNQDKAKLERARRTMQEHLALPTSIIDEDIHSKSTTYALVPKGNAKLLVDYFKTMCYRGEHKVVPQCVLNGIAATKKGFIDGMLAGGSQTDDNGLVKITDQSHKTVLAGLASMLQSLGLEYSLVQIRENNPEVYGIRLIKDDTDDIAHIKTGDVIERIETFEIDDYVYDIETENHHFCGGVGNVLLHNTDSLFLKEPSQESINMVVGWAKDELGVDLEIDKQYRYVVFSDLKKNYLGVLPDGTVDVKGLTGKKSHTPPFIRSAFYEILGILGKVGSQKDFESAKEKIKNIIQRDAKNLEAHKIPMQDLSFNVMINKSLASYGKKVNAVKTTMDGKASQVETYKGLPQHIKAAKLLAERGKEIKAGDIISYVKTKSGDGVKPVELAKPDEIDTEKYLEAMESTFDQLLAALNFDFKSVLGKPRQQSLDELFWSKS